MFADPEADCVFGERDTPLAGVKIELLNAVGVVVQTTFTNAAGQYKFDNLAPGTYAVREQQPSGYFQGGQRAGSAGGVATENLISQIVLASNVTAVNYDFCELLPGSISGRVHADPEGDCIVGPNDIPLAGVSIDLLDANGIVVASTLTDSLGFYRFAGIAPGTYSVREHQPAGFLDGLEHVGTAGGVIAGDDLVGAIPIGSGVNATDYDFCERPLGSISGYVFQDGPTIFVRRGESVDPNTVRDGVRGPGDLGIAGVTLLLGDASGQPILDSLGRPRVAVTDANGFYSFAGLLPGLYTVREIQPGTYIDFLDTAGTTGGLAVNPQANVDPLILQQLTVPHNFDAILRIPLPAGRTSVENNFSEVRIQEQSPIFVQEIIPTRELRVFSPAALLPPVRGKLLPEPLAAFIPPEFIGGNSALGYTWHLSVIDGGLPRSIESGEMLVDASSNLFNVSAWTGGDMDEAQWTLVRDYEEPARRQSSARPTRSRSAATSTATVTPRSACSATAIGSSISTPTASGTKAISGHSSARTATSRSSAIGTATARTTSASSVPRGPATRGDLARAGPAPLAQPQQVPRQERSAQGGGCVARQAHGESHLARRALRRPDRPRLQLRRRRRPAAGRRLGRQRRRVHRRVPRRRVAYRPRRRRPLHERRSPRRVRRQGRSAGRRRLGRRRRHQRRCLPQRHLDPRHQQELPH